MLKLSFKSILQHPGLFLLKLCHCEAIVLCMHPVPIEVLRTNFSRLLLIGCYGNVRRYLQFYYHRNMNEKTYVMEKFVTH